MSNGSMKMIGHVSSHSSGGPNLSKALTPEQINDAWVKYIDTTFNVTHTS